MRKKRLVDLHLISTTPLLPPTPFDYRTRQNQENSLLADNMPVSKKAKVCDTLPQPLLATNHNLTPLCPTNDSRKREEMANKRETIDPARAS
jgi:hypothetical protein